MQTCPKITFNLAQNNIQHDTKIAPNGADAGAPRERKRERESEREGVVCTLKEQKERESEVKAS